MKKPVRNTLLLLVVLFACLSVLIMSAPVAFATEQTTTQSDQEYLANRASAIARAKYAIGKIPDPSKIAAYEQDFIDRVAQAFALVEIAREEFDVEDHEIDNLAHLYEAEKRVLRMLAIRAAQDAIDLIPPADQITEEHRALIEEARRLVNIAIYEHGATEFEICWRLDKLKEAEGVLPEEPEPEPKPKPDDRLPTPPTGGITGLIMLGAALSGTGLLIANRRRGKH